MPSSPLERLERALRACLDWTVSFILAAIAGICFAEVVLRYGFGESFGWYDEFVGYLLVWLTFVGAVLAQSHRQHIGIENLVDRAPERVRRTLLWSQHLLLVGIHLVLLVYGAQLVSRFLTERAITLPVPMGIVYLILPGSAALMLAVEGIQLARLVSRSER